MWARHSGATKFTSPCDAFHRQCGLRDGNFIEQNEGIHAMCWVLKEHFRRAKQSAGKALSHLFCSAYTNISGVPSNTEEKEHKNSLALANKDPGAKQSAASPFWIVCVWCWPPEFKAWLIIRLERAWLLALDAFWGQLYDAPKRKREDVSYNMNQFKVYLVFCWFPLKQGHPELVINVDFQILEVGWEEFNN